MIDEVSGYELDVDTLNMILDGQKVSLDSKYGRVFEKKRNVPIILLGNTLPYTYNTDSFNSRVFEVHFFSDCPPIVPGRLAATLYDLCLRFGLMAPPSVGGVAFSFSFDAPFSAADKALLKRVLGRPVESQEARFATILPLEIVSFFLF